MLYSVFYLTQSHKMIGAVVIVIVTILCIYQFNNINIERRNSTRAGHLRHDMYPVTRIS